MTDKQASSYEEIMDVLKEKQPNLNPTDVTLDFEQAAIKAIQHVFPMAEIHLCLFHFGQSIWRHVQSCGLQSIYASDPDFAQNIKLLIALAFVPVLSVVAAYEELIETDFYDEDSESEYKDQIQTLLAYFESTYIYRIDRKGAKKPPLFPPAMWNVNEQVLTGNLQYFSYNLNSNINHPINFIYLIQLIKFIYYFLRLPADKQSVRRLS